MEATGQIAATVCGDARVASSAAGIDSGARHETSEGEWIRTIAGRWWVLHTRSRNEKRVSSELERERVRHYLPLVSVKHTYAKHKATFQLPLFPGYVFLCGDAGDCDKARRTA